MAAKLSVGTVVELLSGGPLMTVVKDRTEQSNKIVGVAWFDGATLDQKEFPKDALRVKAAAPGAEAKEKVPTE